MKPVSSVEAFLALYLDDPRQDAAAAEIFAELSAEDRAVLLARGRSNAASPENVTRAVSSRPQLSEAAAAHAEGLALVQIRRALAARGLLEP